MLKIKAATLVVGSLAAILSPTGVQEASKEDALRQGAVLSAAAASTATEIKLPEFVSTENFANFVEATRQSDAVSHDQGRLAAERLLAKFEDGGTHANRAFLHGIVEGKLAAGASDGTAALIGVAAAGQGPSELDVGDGASGPGDTTDAGDPSRPQVLAALVGDPNAALKSDADVADPAKPASDIVRPAARRRVLSAPEITPRRARRARTAHSVVRLKLKQVANSEMKDKWGQPSGLTNGASPPQEAYTRAPGGPTQAMVPLIVRCENNLSEACRANQTFCGC